MQSPIKMTTGMTRIKDVSITFFFFSSPPALDSEVTSPTSLPTHPHREAPLRSARRPTRHHAPAVVLLKPSKPTGSAAGAITPRIVNLHRGRRFRGSQIGPLLKFWPAGGYDKSRSFVMFGAVELFA